MENIIDKIKKSRIEESLKSNTGSTLIQRFLLKHYKIVPETSESQLKKDFNIFPPNPLVCNAGAIPFKIVSVSWLGAMLNHLVFFEKIVRNDKEYYDFPGSLLMDDVAQKIRQAKNSLAHAKSQIFGEAYRSLGYFKKILIVLVITVLTPFLVLALMFKSGPNLFGAVRNLFSAVRNSYNAQRGNAGCFRPVIKLDYEIIVHPDRASKKGDEFLSSVISHEHIHLLQHLNKTHKSSNELFKKRLVDADFILELFSPDIPQIFLYLLDQVEMEARLHELVLSYYRAYKCLPLTVDGFLSLLNGCKEWRGEIADVIRSICDSSSSGSLGKSYSIRAKLPVNEIGGVFIFIKTPELKSNFIREVLPVMYGNLISYYGDINASKAFLNQIQRPNLFDRLYGMPSHTGSPLMPEGSAVASLTR